MKYYAVEPEVAGGWGENTVTTGAPGKSTVQRLHYEFDGWLGDELLESTPCFIVTQRLAREIEHSRFTGAAFDEVEISKSDLFNQLHPDLQLPRFAWLKIEGTPGRDDFGIAPGLMLVVSERALALLKRVGFAN